MSLSRVKAIILQELYIIQHSTETIVDIVIIPIISIILFAFLSLYLSASNPEVAQQVVVGMLLWQILYISQYAMCLGTLWNIWSRNLSNLFITPLHISEYIFAYALSGILKSFSIFLLCSIGLYLFFGFDITDVGILNLVLYFLLLLWFGFSIGIVILAFIFRFGTRINALAWGILPIFQPLTGSLFPVSILPKPLQFISYLLAPTYVFESARLSIADGRVRWEMLGVAFIENILFFIFAIWLFGRLFRKSQETGQFARNES